LGIYCKDKASAEINQNIAVRNSAGEASSIKGAPASEAVTYGYGSNGGYVLKDDVDYKKPEIVQKLGNYKMTLGGNKEIAEENPSLSTYYDGSNRLNIIQITCRVYVNKNDCLHKSACGWCSQTKTCISGTSQGPLEPCLASTYKFSVPSLVGTFDPKASLAAENYIGTTINLKPDN